MICYQCRDCDADILLSRIQDPASRRKWQKWEMDGRTIHNCKNQQQGGYNNQSSTPSVVAEAEEEINTAIETPTTPTTTANIISEDQITAVQVATLAQQFSRLVDEMAKLTEAVNSLKQEEKKATTIIII